MSVFADYLQPRQYGRPHMHVRVADTAVVSDGAGVLIYGPFEDIMCIGHLRAAPSPRCRVQMMVRHREVCTIGSDFLSRGFYLPHLVVAGSGDLVRFIVRTDRRMVRFPFTLSMFCLVPR